MLHSETDRNFTKISRNRFQVSVQTLDKTLAESSAQNTSFCSWIGPNHIFFQVVHKPITRIIRICFLSLLTIHDVGFAIYVRIYDPDNRYKSEMWILIRGLFDPIDLDQDIQTSFTGHLWDGIARCTATVQLYSHLEPVSLGICVVLQLTY